MKKETVRALRGLMIFAAVLVLGITHFGKVVTVLGFFVSILEPFLIGGAIAFVLNLPMKAIEQHLFQKENKLSKWKRPISFMLSLFAIIFVISVVCMLIVPQLGAAFSELAVEIPEFCREMLKILQNVFEDNPQIQEYIASLDFTTIDWNVLVSKIANALGSGIGSVVISTVSAASNMFGIIFDLVIAFVFAIYLLMQKETLENQSKRLLYAYLPRKVYDKTMEVFGLLYKNFSNFISSQCLEAVILGTMFVVAMFLCRLPYAVLIGSLIAVTALIPIVGAFIGCVVGAFLILVENPISAVAFVVLFLVLQQVEGNLIYPKVVGSSVGLPAIWVLVAVSVGGSLFGVLGMLIFIPITSTLYTLLREDVNERNTKKEELAVERTKKDSECAAKTEGK